MAVYDATKRQETFLEQQCNGYQSLCDTAENAEEWTIQLITLSEYLGSTLSSSVTISDYQCVYKNIERGQKNEGGHS